MLFRKDGGKEQTPLLVVEVKRTNQSEYYLNRDKYHLASHLPQLFRYLRHLAILHKRKTVFGVLSDYR